MTAQPDAQTSSTIPTLPTQSGRFVLRPFTLDDAPDVHTHLNDPRIAPWTLHIAYPYPEGAGAGWIATHGPAAAAGTDLTWAIVTPEDDRVIGAIALHLTPKHRRAEIGYWLAVPWWGQGVMTDAARTVIAYGFEALGLHRIQATCLPHNVGSYRVMEKAGMTFEGVLRDYVIHGDGHADIAMYAIVAGREGEPSASR
ncbi:MAG: GNAT family N-acetyltransferase [Thermomicrobiales bacterium]